jgi:hypothetical protein
LNAPILSARPPATATSLVRNVSPPAGARARDSIP